MSWQRALSKVNSLCLRAAFNSDMVVPGSKHITPAHGCFQFHSKRPGTKWKWTAFAVFLACCLVGVAVLIGYAVAQSKSRGTLVSTQPSSSSSIASDPGTASSLQGVKQLPPPGTDAAMQLLEAPDTPSWVRELYTYSDDSIIITTDATASFLKLLQQRLPAMQGASGGSIKLVAGNTAPAASGSPEQAAATPVPNNNNGSSSLDLSPFIAVAQDVLGYLRFCRSKALLQLLREFSESGSIAYNNVDPDQLQGEVQSLLNITHLNSYYITTTSKDGAQGNTEVPVGKPHGRRLRSHHHHHQQQQQRQNPSRQLRADSAELTNQLLAQMTGSPPTAQPAATSPTTTETATTTSQTYAATTGPAVEAHSGIPATGPVKSHPQFLQDMLCDIQSYSPSGLTGVVPDPVSCPQPQAVLFSAGQAVFKPVVIPVAFHCLKFLQGETVLPPDWGPEQAAQNLIDKSNKLYKDTGIQFKLQEVRYDPQKYPYLLRQSLDNWQGCSHNSVSTAGLSCLKGVASTPEVAALAAKHVINVFVSGAAEEAAYCDRLASPPPLCTRGLSMGHSGAKGPWFLSAPSPTWTEDSPEENWVFITYDMFNPRTRNSPRFWDGGGCTLSHEIGHYLGLMHTHEGLQPCDANGADAVPDTPPNQQVDAFAAGSNSLADLSGWCSNFRTGKRPAAAQLAVFDSCKDTLGEVDNVFNVMSYIPDACYMIFSPDQVERMQWAIVTYRPKLLAAYSI